MGRTRLLFQKCVIEMSMGGGVVHDEWVYRLPFRLLDVEDTSPLMKHSDDDGRYGTLPACYDPIYCLQRRISLHNLWCIIIGRFSRSSHVLLRFSAPNPFHFDSIQFNSNPISIPFESIKSDEAQNITTTTNTSNTTNNTTNNSTSNTTGWLISRVTDVF